MPDEPTAVATGELTPINIIRTETVLSRLPIHNLAKTGRVTINITRRSGHGTVEVHWEVSANSKYGEPRQLAYKLDTVVINRRIDEQRRPLPKVLKLGSLNQICGDLELSPSGKNMQNLKRAILQNAGAMITAKLSYQATDGSQRRLEAAFTRYSVIFTGERLPGGEQADGVYLVFNDPYWDVLNSAPVRPLDYEYLKRLAPMPQRFYEMLSYRMYAALKNQYATARLSYEEYCAASAQTRYLDYEHFKKQMYKIHRPHLQSGYIGKVRYEAGVDEEGRPDWVMYYVPGPRARAEYATFQARVGGGAETGDLLSGGEQGGEVASPDVLGELQRRGVTRTEACKLLKGAESAERILEQLEWGDHLIGQATRGRFYNPPGFYVHLIREGIVPPPEFESRRRRQARVERQRAGSETDRQAGEREQAYEEYVRGAAEAYAADAAQQAELERLIECKQAELVRQYRSLALGDKDNLRALARAAAVAELGRRAPVMSLQEFCKAV